MIIEVEQGTPEWLQMRCGMGTGSGIGKAIKRIGKSEKNPNGTKYSADREKYLMEVVCERLTGRATEHYVTDAMLWGIEHEPIAREEYGMARGCDVDPGKFAIHDRMKWFGSSSDGLVGEDGCIEIKCPTSLTHLQWVIDGVVPDEHIDQMKAAMSCYNRQWCDFISYDPRMPKDLRLFVRRLERDEPMIVEMEQEVEKFLAEVDVLLDTIKKRKAAMCVTSLVEGFAARVSS